MGQKISPFNRCKTCSSQWEQNLIIITAQKSKLTMQSAYNDTYFEGLPYSCDAISAYHWAGTDLFVLCLHNREIRRFYPSDVAGFHSWLQERNIRQVS